MQATYRRTSICSEILSVFLAASQVTQVVRAASRSCMTTLQCRSRSIVMAVDASKALRRDLVRGLAAACSPLFRAPTSEVANRVLRATVVYGPMSISAPM